MKKLTQEELTQVAQLTQRFQQTLFELGSCEKQINDTEEYLNKFIENKNNLLKDLKTIEDKEMELSIQLRDKYGEGTINPQTGEITPL